MISTNQYNIVGIILARGGSKGVPKKNIKMLAGKPLIAYTIEASLKSNFIQRTIVSTDDVEIKKVAEAFGAQVPFLRPAELAQDEVPNLPVLQHAVNFIEEKDKKIDFVVTLQPTSPLRKACHIDEAIVELIKSGADSVVSLCEVEHSPYWMKAINNGKVLPFIESEYKSARRQDLPIVYRPNGAVYATKRDVLMNQHKVLGNNTKAIIMKHEESLDIDTQLDFNISEFILKSRVS